MTTLEAGFEDKLVEAVMDDVESKVIDEPGNLTHRFLQTVHENLREYGRRYDYNVEPVIDSLGLPEVRRTDNELVIRVGWDHPAAPYFEFGTSRHTIQGKPVLSFVWENPPDWVTTEFEQERGSGGRFESGYRVFLPEVEVEGLPEGRFIRDALRWLELQLSGRIAAGPGATL